MAESLLTLLSHLTMLVGVFFFVAGTVGLLRFPDVFSRLHAITKADTVGLGLVLLGVSFDSEGVRDRVLLLVIWLLVMVSSAVACQLYGRFERERQNDASEPQGES